MKIQVPAIVKPNGVLDFEDHEARMLWANACASFKGKKVTLVVGPRVKPRSKEQNAYWWAVVIKMIADEMGEDDHDAVHYALLSELGYGEKRVDDWTGLVLHSRGSSSALSTAGFEELCTKARAWGARVLGLNIPEPNEIAL